MNWKKNTILFLTSQAVSLFGSMLVQYAITWHITLTTQSGAMMTIAIICGFLPMFFLSPFAGVWADRYDRKRLIILADALIALTTLTLALLFLTGYRAVWPLFAASAVRALGSGIQAPAIGAFLPQIVPAEKLTRVNAANSSIQSLVTLVSPMLSGALLAVATMETIFFIDVITAVVAIAILALFLPVPAHAGALTRQKTGYLEDMRAGLAYIKAHDYLKSFFLFETFFFISAAPASFLTPLQVTRSYGGDVWRLSAIEVAFSLGMTAGGILMASWGGFRNKVHTMALVGIVIPVFNTPATVLLQQKVEGAYLGRVFGVMNMIASSMMPLGMLVFGPIADFGRIEFLLIGTGLLMLVQGLFVSGNRALIAAGEPAVETA